MAVFNKWVALKIVEFLFCVACLVAKRVASDDEARLALLLQKLSREWSLLTSVTWDNVGSAFADATYGGYVIITFGLVFARVYQEIPRGRRVLEGILLGFGLLFFLVLGGLELASLDSVPESLTVNACILGALSLSVAALFLLDLMGPRVYTATRPSQTDSAKSPQADKKVTIVTQSTNGMATKGVSIPGTTTTGQPNNEPANIKQNGYAHPERPKDLNLNIEKDVKKDTTSLFDSPKTTLSKLEDLQIEKELETSKFGSLRNIEGGNYVRLSDPMVIPDRLHYEQELAKFNEKYFRDYLEYAESLDGSNKLSVKENYLPELQTPVFSKVKSGRLKSLYDDMSPSYERKRQGKSPTRAKTVATPTLQQLENYLKSPAKSRRADTPAMFPMERIVEKANEVEGRVSGTPTDPGYVQYAADKWPDKRELRTPRHSPTE
ncbi:uncharacterized protein LOC126978581 [Leptidea sinapis]|uniref:uncharacterized protein LOC126978581 n=1 Tax=Leptidea sinapis TaxID=189913 RepID=UPI00212F12CE|nr:uncharacterized protein LOC126978581 [Leptidea sinapis]